MVARDIPRARAASCLLPPLSCRLRTIASRSTASIGVSLRRVTERHSGGNLSAPLDPDRWRATVSLRTRCSCETFPGHGNGRILSLPGARLSRPMASTAGAPVSSATFTRIHQKRPQDLRTVPNPGIRRRIILDRTLEPAVREFGYQHLEMIDPIFMRNFGVSRDSLRATGARPSQALAPRPGCRHQSPVRAPAGVPTCALRSTYRPPTV